MALLFGLNVVNGSCGTIMNSRNIINIILLLLVAILLAVLFLEPGAQKKPLNTLTIIDKKSIHSIKITRLTGDPIEFIKQQKQWLLTTPYQIKANEFRINALIRIVEETSQAQYPISEIDLKKFKLAPPQATLRLNDTLIQFGGSEPLKLNRYVRINNTLHLIKDTYFYQINSSFNLFIDHALIGKNETITHLKLPDVDVKLKQGKWIVQPQPKNYSADDVIQLISEWNNIHAIDIKPIENKKASNQIEVTLKHRLSPIIFEIRQSKDNFILARPDIKLQYILGKDKTEQLLQLPGNDTGEQLIGNQ